MSDHCAADMLTKRSGGVPEEEELVEDAEGNVLTNEQVHGLSLEGILEAQEHEEKKSHFLEAGLSWQAVNK